MLQASRIDVCTVNSDGILMKMVADAAAAFSEPST
jgi:hypothetical protein